MSTEGRAELQSVRVPGEPRAEFNIVNAVPVRRRFFALLTRWVLTPLYFTEGVCLEVAFKQ